MPLGFAVVWELMPPLLLVLLFQKMLVCSLLKGENMHAEFSLKLGYFVISSSHHHYKAISLTTESN
jgi:hypothetical protein